jgi:hypothetical protein
MHNNLIQWDPKYSAMEAFEFNGRSIIRKEENPWKETFLMILIIKNMEILIIFEQFDRNILNIGQILDFFFDIYHLLCSIMRYSRVC